jgi:GWxTD domain-containing protein
MNTRRWILSLSAAVVVLAPAVRCHARGFALYANAYLDSTRVSAVRVTAEVPFRSLVFFKKQGWYDAQYEVYLSIERLDGKGGEPSTSVLQGRAVARSYAETSAPDHRSKSTRVFALAPGRYRVDATLRIQKTGVAMQRSLELEVPDFLATGIGFGTPLVITVPAGEVVAFSRWRDFQQREKSDLAQPSDLSLELFDRRPAVRFEIYTDGRVGASTACDLFYEVRSANNRQVLYGKRRIDLTGNDDVFVLPIDVDDWEPGSYTVNLRARADEPAREASASVELNVDVTRAMLGRDFEETLEILGLIASDDELSGLRGSNAEDRAAEWSRFWAARDPDPTSERNEALEEYLRRVRYVMKNFSTLEPGWRSDRGQVYIRHGAPERIERTSDSRFQGEYEIWRYAGTGRVFVFYDMFGLGDYRLVQGGVF